MSCGNGSDRTQHPFELFGEDWLDWGSDYAEKPVAPAQTTDQQSDDSPSRINE